MLKSFETRPTHTTPTGTQAGLSASVPSATCDPSERNLQDLPSELMAKILEHVSPGDLVTIRETSRQLKSTVDDVCSNPTFLKSFLASNVKLRAGQDSDPQIEAYQKSVANAITGVGDAYLKNKNIFLQGLQSLEMQQKGGFFCDEQTSYAWNKNHLWWCGKRPHFLGKNTPEKAFTFTPVFDPNTEQPPWGQAAILVVAAASLRQAVVHTTRDLFLSDRFPPAYYKVVDKNTGQPPWGNAVLLGVAPGWAHTAVWTTQGLFVCGSNGYGQLGLGANAPETVTTFTPVPSLGKTLYDFMQQ